MRGGLCERARRGWRRSRREPPFDIVFLDPPYDSDLLAAARGGAARGRLAPDARIYLERRAREPLPALPAGWKELRAGRGRRGRVSSVRHMKRSAVYPGTFDPDHQRPPGPGAPRARACSNASSSRSPRTLTRRRCSRSSKRVELARQVLGDIPGVEVMGYKGLTVDFAREHDVQVVVRGLRAVSDFEFEFQLANMSRHLHRELETVFLTPQEQFTFISSTLVREIAILGGDVKEFVHPLVAAELKKMKRV